MRNTVLFLSAVVLIFGTAAGDNEPAHLTFNPKVEYQAMEGLGATIPWIPFWTEKRPEIPEKGFLAKRNVKLKGRHVPLPESFMDHVLDSAVYELGITRLRLEVGPYMEKENDNDDPNETNKEAFFFAWLDSCVEEIVLPVKKRLARRGDDLVLTVSFAVESWETPEWLKKPDEYAEFMRTVLIHLRDKYKLMPSYWVPGNESRIGHSAMVQMGEWMGQNKFTTLFAFPEGRSLMSSLSCMGYLEKDLSAAKPYIGQITYHMFGDGSNLQRRKLRDLADALGVSTAMTERKGGRPDKLFLDLTEANVSAWQRHLLMEYGEVATNDGYFTIKRDLTSVMKGMHYWRLGQYFHYIRPGSVRVGATSSNDSVSPVAFMVGKRNKKKPAMVIYNKGKEREVIIGGLPKGNYRCTFSTVTEPREKLPVVKIGKDKAVTLTVPSRAVLTITAAPPPSFRITPLKFRKDGDEDDGKKKSYSKDPPRERSKKVNDVLARGTVEGTIAAKGKDWVSVRSISGKVQRYIPKMRKIWGKKEPEIDQKAIKIIGKLKVGDSISIRWFVDTDVRISSIRSLKK